MTIMSNDYLVLMKNMRFMTSKCVICEQVRSAEYKIIYAKRKNIYKIDSEQKLVSL
jgi:hypothetical protein